MYVQPLEGTALAGLRAGPGSLPGRGLGRPVQDPLRRHRRQQPPDGRLPRPDRALAPARARRRASGRSGSSASLPAPRARPLLTPIREPQGLIKVGGIAQGLMLPLIAGATLYLRQRDADRRVGADLPDRRPHLARLLRDLGRGGLQRLRPRPGAACDCPSALAATRRRGLTGVDARPGPSVVQQARRHRGRPGLDGRGRRRRSSRGPTDTVIRALLLRARYVSFAVAAVVLLVLLVLFGKRVSYEQSIKSFFADDDPVMVAYQKAAQAFGDDNFVFVAYDDPELLTPGRDGPRRRAGRGGRPGADPGRAPGRVARRDAAALEDRRRPARARPAAGLRCATWR